MIIPKNKYIIVTIKPWNIQAAKRFIVNRHNCKFMLITHKRELTYRRVKRFRPRYIFFPHWSWRIPGNIYNNFECIVFHMTDLPFGRGGSPLQNLIVRGIRETKISAVRVTKQFDSGPIYLKKDVSLDGSAGEIYKKVSSIIFNNMIPYIIKKEPVPYPQEGRAIIFKRRKPKESKIPFGISLERAYDYIRMLDADEYPHAFIDIRNFRFEFKDAVKKSGNCICANVCIKDRRKRQWSRGYW